MHIDPPPAGGRPAVGRAAVRALEPDAVGAHRPAVSDLAAQRAQHLQPGERRRQCYVPPLARLQRQR